MKELLDQLAATIALTHGLALLAAPAVVPLLVFSLLFGGLVKVGRGYWGRGTETRQWAKKTLAFGEDEMDLAIAQDIMEFY